jgi:hypothetical protein
MTLIKALFLIYRHILSRFPIPIGVAYRMEKPQRDFLWGELGMSLNFI